MPGNHLSHSSSALLRSYLSSTLPAEIGPQALVQISDNLSSIKNLKVANQETIKNAFAVGYSRQMQLLVGFSGAALLASFLMWERRPRAVK